MKRAFPQEPLPDSRCCPNSEPTVGSNLSGSHRRARTSAAMLGLALSVGASASLMTDAKSAQAVSLPASSMASPLNSNRDVAPSEAVFHTVADGESLWQIALAHDVNVQVIRAANGISADEVIRAGQVIRIPAAAAVPTVTPKVQPVVAPQTVAAAPSSQSRGADSVADHGASGLSTDALGTETTFSDVNFQSKVGGEAIVAPVDAEASFVATAAGFNTPAQPNAVEPSVAAVQSLDRGVQPEPSALPAPPVQEAETPVSASPQGTVPETLAPETLAKVESGSVVDVDATVSLPAADRLDYALVSYRVQAGDTLWSIAQRLGLESEDLVSLNQTVEDPNRLAVGETLLVPAETLPLGIPTATAPQTTTTEDVSEVSENVYASAATPATDVGSISQRLQALNSSSWDREALYERIRSERLAAAAQQSIQPSQVTSGQEAPLSARVLEETVETPSLAEVEAGGSATVGGTQPDPHVANLIANVRAMQSQPSASMPMAAPRAMAASISTTVDAERPLQSLPAIEADEAVQPAVNQPINQELLAAAPLSPGAYVSEMSAPIGITVSPGTPMMPDSGEFLPEAPIRSNGYVWPARGVLTSGYGWRWGRMHRGIDIAGPVGTPIYAAGGGTVVSSGWNSGGYGNMVDIRHADGSTTRYAHNSRLLVQSGQQVRQGQQIAEMGSTGYSTGPHLHFEIHLPGSGSVNPMAHLPQR